LTNVAPVGHFFGYPVGRPGLLFVRLLTALTLTARLFFAPARGLLSALLTATLVLLSIVWHFSFLLI